MASDATFVVSINLNGNELRNVRAHILSAAPTGTTGKFYYNSTTNTLEWYNGSTWVAATGAAVANLSGQASAFGQSAANGSAATAARSDHYHALPAHNAAAHSAIKLSDLAAPTADIAMGGYKITGLGAAAANGQAVRYEQVVGVYLALSGGTISGNLTVSGTVYSTSIYGQSGNDGSAFSWNGTYWSLPSVRPSVALHMNSFKITNMADGTSATDGATKGQVDTVASAASAAQATANAALPKTGGTVTGPIVMSGGTASINMGGNKIGNMGDGTGATDAVTKQQLDAAVAAAQTGLDVKGSVKAATTASVDLASGMSLATVDGVSIAVGERVLVKNQSTASENGIYTRAAGTTANIRATDADTSAKVTAGMFTFVEQGGSQADTAWVLTTDNPITLDTTALTFAQFSGPGAFTAGDGIDITGSQISAKIGDGLTHILGETRVNFNVVPRKYSATLTTSATSYVISHGLGTQDVIVQVREVGSPYGVVQCGVELTSSTQCKVYFATAPSANQYRVTVIG
jgi:hypothetical protein